MVAEGVVNNPDSRIWTNKDGKLVLGVYDEHGGKVFDGIITEVVITGSKPTRSVSLKAATRDD